MSAEIDVKVVCENLVVRFNPSRDVHRCGEIPEGHPAGVDLVYHHKHLLLGRVDDDVAEVMADAREEELEGLVPRDELVPVLEGDLGDGAVRVMG